MSKSQRRSPRIPMKLEVEFTHPEFGELYLTTKDISETGVFIKLPEDQQPPVGTLAHVKLKNSFADGEEPQRLEMKVVRATEIGIGLVFV